MWPFNAASAPARCPTCMDIGAGQGLFAVQFAQAYPHSPLIAIVRTQAHYAKRLPCNSDRLARCRRLLHRCSHP